MRLIHLIRKNRVNCIRLTDALHGKSEYIRSTTDFYSSMDKAGYNRIRKNTAGVQVVGLKLKEGQDFLE